MYGNWIWSIRLDIHRFMMDWYARKGSRRWWKHKESVRRCEDRLMRLRNG